MIVSIGFAIVAAGAITKSDFAHQSSLFQIAQRVIDSRATDPGHLFARSVKHLGRGGVMISRLHHVEHNLSLARQGQVRCQCFALVCHRWNYNNSKSCHRQAATGREDLVEVLKKL